MPRINAGIVQVMASVTFGFFFLGGKRRYSKGIHQISVCISLPIFWQSLWLSMTICNYVCVREYLAECDSEQNQNSISKLKVDLGAQYATNNTHRVSLLSSLSFPVDLFVYLIMLLTGQLLLSFHDLSQMRFLLCSSSNSLIRMECLSMWPVLNVCCPLSITRTLLRWTGLGTFVSSRLTRSLNMSKGLTNIYETECIGAYLSFTITISKVI